MGGGLLFWSFLLMRERFVKNWFGYYASSDRCISRMILDHWAFALSAANVTLSTVALLAECWLILVALVLRLSAPGARTGLFLISFLGNMVASARQSLKRVRLCLLLLV